MADFEYNPVAGWEDETIFPDYPTAQEVRPMLQRLFDQIRNAFNAHTADIVTDADGVHGLKIENGIFTPVLKGQTTPGNNTYSIQTGYYRVIGKRVFIDIYIALTAKDAAMAGNIIIDGLPYVAKSETNHRYGLSIGPYGSIDLDAAKPQISGNIINNTSNIAITVSGDNAAAFGLNATQITGTSSLVISASYDIA
jgi:hypothetical protein